LTAANRVEPEAKSNFGMPRAYHVRMRPPRPDYSWSDLRVRAEDAMREAWRVAQDISHPSPHRRRAVPYKATAANDEQGECKR